MPVGHQNVSAPPRERQDVAGTEHYAAVFHA
jgi:hypothetical protein